MIPRSLPAWFSALWLLGGGVFWTWVAWMVGLLFSRVCAAVVRRSARAQAPGRVPAPAAGDTVELAARPAAPTITAPIPTRHGEPRV